jgi:membrane protein YqaA with SNARE-associated domain
MEVAYLTLFSIAFLAATIFPFSSEVVLAGLSASSEEKIPLLVVASFGNVLGSSFNWVLGKYTRNLETKKWFPFSTNKLQKASFWFTKYGKWSLLFAWLPVIGDPLTFIAGVVRLRFVPFLILVTIGKVSRYILIIMGVDWIVN